ncbi:hypothetical protein PAENIP36_61140 [Paenibacillus sp. P36]
MNTSAKTVINGIVKYTQDTTTNEHQKRTAVMNEKFDELDNGSLTKILPPCSSDFLIGLFMFS